MSIAEKLTTIAENEQKVYDAGKKAECERFWNVLQDNGNRRGYNYAFYGSYWADEIYNPLYPIIMTVNNSANATFQGSEITDTKVSLTLGTRPNMFFYGCEELTRVREFNVLDGVELPTNTFSGAPNLEEIIFSGVIGYNLNLSYNTKLTHDSIMTAVNCLKDYSADTSGTTYKITLGSTNLEKLTESEIKIAEEKGWDIA